MNKMKAMAIFMGNADDKYSSNLPGIGLGFLKKEFENTPLNDICPGSKLFYLKEIGIEAVNGDREATDFLINLLNNEEAGIRLLAANYLSNTEKGDMWGLYKAMKDRAFFEKDEEVKAVLYNGKYIIKKRANK